MKCILVILILFLTQIKVCAYTYHAVYDLNGKKVYETKNASIDYYSDDYMILKDDNGYFLKFSNGKKGNYYKLLKKLPMTNKYLLAQSSFMGENFDLINTNGKIVIPYKNNYLWDYIFTPDDKIIVYDEKEKTPYLIDINGKKIKITEAQFEKEFNLNEQRKEQFSVEPVMPKEYKYVLRYKNYFAYQENGLLGVRDYSNNLILKPTFKKIIKIIDNYIYEVDF